MVKNVRKVLLVVSCRFGVMMFFVWLSPSQHLRV